MTQRLKKHGKQALAMILILMPLVLLCNGPILAVTSGTEYEPTHMQSIQLQEIYTELARPVSYTPYIFEEYSPLQLTSEGEPDESEAPQLLASSEYMLDSEIADLMERLAFPHDSSTLKKQLLETLQNKIFIRHYSFESENNTPDSCQILLAGDPLSKEILLVGLNAVEDDNSHTFKLLIINEDGSEVHLQTSKLTAHSVYRQEDVPPDELLLLQQQPGLTVEVTEEIEAEPQEPAPPPLSSTQDAVPDADSLPHGQENPSLPSSPASGTQSEAPPPYPEEPINDTSAAQEVTAVPLASGTDALATGPKAPLCADIYVSVFAQAGQELPEGPPALPDESSSSANTEESAPPADIAVQSLSVDTLSASASCSEEPPPESASEASAPASSFAASFPQILSGDIASSAPEQPHTVKEPEIEPPAQTEEIASYNINLLSSPPLEIESGVLPIIGSGMVVYSGSLNAPILLANTTPVPATLSGNKTATKLSGTADIFRIDLDIRGANGIGNISGMPADIVLVVDLSGSMDENNSARWIKTKSAMDTLSNGLLDPNVGHEIALIGYSSQIYLGPNGYNTFSQAAHRTICDFTPSATSFKSSYNRGSAISLITEGGIVKGSGTNSHAGFVGARDLLETRKNNGRPKFIIFITDGMANQYYSSDTPPYEEKFDYSSDINNTANVSAVNTAELIRNTYGANIFSIGVDFPSNQQAKGWFLLNGSASSLDQAFMTSKEGLDQVISNVMGVLEDAPIAIPHGTVHLTDNMSQYVEYQPSYGISAYQSDDNGVTWSAFSGTEEPSFADNLLTWDINDFSPVKAYRVSYYVKLKDEYHGEKLHLDQTEGANPASGANNDGVVANADTFLSSDAVERQTVLVPTVYAPKPLVTPATLTAHKTASAVSASEQSGVYDISVLISGTKYMRNNGSTSYIEQTDVTLTDPMSEYVNYIGEVQLQAADKGDSSWDDISGGYSYDTVTHTITWAIPNFSSDKQYRLTYRVSVKPEYAGTTLHKNQTSGDPARREAGTDGVVANNYTCIQSDLVDEQEVLVPTVYLDNQISSTPAMLTGNKIAQPVEGDNGLYNIVVTVDGQPKIDVVNGVSTETEHSYVRLIDPMSEYVDYVGNSYVEWAMDNSDVWTLVPEPTGMLYSPSNRTIDWFIINYTSERQYRLVYQVRVREEYAGARLHADQTHGKQGSTLPLPGTDGVVANEYTYLKSSLLEDKEVFVPTVYRDAPIVTPPSIQGLKTAEKIPDGDYEYDISIVITGEQMLQQGYGGDIYTDHSSVTILDPMSEFVSYLGEPRYEIADKGSDEWEAYNGSSLYSDDESLLTWPIPDFSSAKQYRITYRVQVQPEYRNKALHKDQTSGKPELREEGIDGVVANGYTYVSSSLVPEQEILVPAIGDPVPVVSGGELEGIKHGSYIPDTEGFFLITLTFSGSAQQTEDLYGNITTVEHEDVVLTDPMSEFVTYQGEAELCVFDEESGDWMLLPTQPAYDEDTHVLSWPVEDFSSDTRYRLTYKIQVKDEYSGARLHQTQTPGDELIPGNDGVLANGKTTLSSSLVEEEEIMVPAVYRNRIVIGSGELEGLKTAQPVLNAKGQFTISIEIRGSDFISDGYGGRQEQTHHFLYVEDPMSEYVTFLDQHEVHAAVRGSNDWQLLPEPDEAIVMFSDEDALLEWYITPFDASKKYRLTYLVQLDEQYYGQALHADQTSGSPDRRQEGTDGLVANGLTKASTELVSNQEINVPTVYVDLNASPFYFYKVDREAAPLDAVQFSLYPCTQASDETHTHSLLAVEGSCWDILNPINATSTTEGLVDFSELPFGDYMLAETKAAPGYALPNGQWLISISEDDVSFEARYTGSDPPPAFQILDGQYTVANYQLSQLPDSGSHEIILTSMAGIALLLLVLLGYRLKCQKKLRQAYQGVANTQAACKRSGGKQHTQNNNYERRG